MAGGQPGPEVRAEVLSSWERSSAVSLDLSAAPWREPEDVVAAWQDSPLGRASRVIVDDLSDLARDGDLMAAITDDTVTISWIAGGRSMSRRADQVHFALGGCWAEDAVGTNALSLASCTVRPATVFSAEHYAPMVHDWVCYSAPILDPHSGRFLGVLDLSTTWDRDQPALLTTVGALARNVEYELATLGSGRPQLRAPELRTRQTRHRDSGLRESGLREQPTLELRTMGRPEIRLGGSSLALSPRQVELLTVLSLHPEGLSLDELTGKVYGDHAVAASTVKAELSHLRHQLGGRIASRPYRLVPPVVSEHQRLIDALGAGDLSAALDCFRGSFLGLSESPEIERWRHHLDVSLRDAVLTRGEPDALYQLGSVLVEDIALHEAALDALDRCDPRHCVVAGRLAAARAL